MKMDGVKALAKQQRCAGQRQRPTSLPRSDFASRKLHDITSRSHFSSSSFRSMLCAIT